MRNCSISAATATKNSVCIPLPAICLCTNMTLIVSLPPVVTRCQRVQGFVNDTKSPGTVLWNLCCTSTSVEFPLYSGSIICNIVSCALQEHKSIPLSSPTPLVFRWEITLFLCGLLEFLGQTLLQVIPGYSQSNGVTPDTQMIFTFHSNICQTRIQSSKLLSVCSQIHKF